MSDYRQSAAEPLEKIARNLPVPEHSVTADDCFVIDIARRIDEAGIVEVIERWAAEDAKGLGGRPEAFPKRALLVAMLVTARLERPMLATVWHHFLCFGISPKMKRLLGVENLSPGPSGYRNVRTRFHAIRTLIDSSPTPKNRRLSPDDFIARVADRAAKMTPGRERQLQTRQEWLTNQFLRIGLHAMPGELWDRWEGGIAVDATPIATFARGPKRRRDPETGKRLTEVHSTDEDAGWYVREGDHADTDAPGQTKSLYGYEHTLVFLAPTTPEESGRYPSLVAAMARPHVPGESPGRNGFSAVKLAHDAALEITGRAPRLLCGDNAYVNALPEEFAVPARARGLGLVVDYNRTQAGRQGEHDGALLIDGRWYCPALPEPLIEATNDYRAGTIDDATYRRRLADRRPYELRPKTHPDASGAIRMMCPAAGTATTMRCSHKPRSQSPLHRGKRSVDLKHLLRSDPPKVCRQQSITIPAVARGRFEQRLTYGTEQWRAAYQTMRSTNEGGNGTAKDAARQNIEAAGRRRIRGQAANALITSMQYAAHNLRALLSFAAKATRDRNGDLRIPRLQRAHREKTGAPAPNPAAPPVPPGDPPDRPEVP